MTSFFSFNADFRFYLPGRKYTYTQELRMMEDVRDTIQAELRELTGQRGLKLGLSDRRNGIGEDGQRSLTVFKVLMLSSLSDSVASTDEAFRVMEHCLAGLPKTMARHGSNTTSVEMAGLHPFAVDFNHCNGRGTESGWTVFGNNITVAWENGKELSNPYQVFADPRNYRAPRRNIIA